MTSEEKALIYFKDLRARKVKDYSSVFDTAPKDSVVYEAVSAEIEIYDTTIKALEQTRWIPCSERLPMAFEFVNCTCHSLIDDREDWVIETVYVPQPSNSPYSDWGNIPMLNSGDCKVVAWIHRDIPEPYKAESEEAK